MSNCNKMVELNIHGYPKTFGFDSYSEWLNYAKQKLSLVQDRITIENFLKRDKFLKTTRDQVGAHPKIVNDFTKDPIPPKNASIGPYQNVRRPGKSSDYKDLPFQRREWGFREKILQGYPNYSPDRIGWGDTNSKVIAGFVTVGDGIFSGIPPHHDISLNTLEARRQAEYGYGRTTGKQMVPSGLCFIQDETSAIGIHVGSDVRFLWHPKMYGNYLANASVSIDQMHMGATLVPKADYRQFLRVGDFVIVEIGIRLNYWNSLLGGNELYNWESIVGYGELYDRVPFVDVYGVNVSEEVMSKISPFNKNEKQYTYNPPLDKKGRNLHKKTLKTPPESFTETKDTPAEEGVRNVIDHPWSTGTPIPVNAGMPFIMTEEFSIDSTDRRAPYPKEIKASEIRDLKGDGTNKGSSLKGQLVSIKNLRIIIPQNRPTLMLEQAIDSSGKLMKGGVYSSSIDLTAPVLSRNEKPPIDDEFEWPNPAPEHLWFNDESHEFWLPNGINFLFDVPDSVVLRYFPDTNPPQLGFWSPITSSNAFYRRDSRTGEYPDKFPKHLTGDYKYWTHAYHETFGVDPSNIKIEMFSFSRRKGPKGLPNSLEWSTPPQNLEEVQELISAGGGYYSTLGFTNDEGWAMRSDESNRASTKPFYIPNGARYQLRKDDKSGNITYNLGITLLETDFFEYWLLPIINASVAAADAAVFGGIPVFTALVGLAWFYNGDFYTGSGPIDFWNSFEIELDKIVENSWPDRFPDYSRMGMPYYAFGSIVQPFPISIDKTDGAYWFTDPNIPKPITTPADGIVLNRTVGDISRHDPNNQLERKALTNYINRYENYKGENPFWRDRHPIDYGYTLYEDEIKNKDLDTAKIQFLPNKIYYAADENGIVIPIRINANTEIARYRVPVPTGLFDISGIAWQYSMGQPGLEWEREGYVMQIWPRFLSDITLKTVVTTEVKKDEKGPIIVTPPPTPPSRIPDITLNLGDSIPLQNINELDCERINSFLKSNNDAIRRTGLSEPIQGCDGLNSGQEMYIIVESDIWYGLTRTFYFSKDKDGKCTCKLVPKGTNLQTPTGV